MNRESFVEAVRSGVYDAAISDTIALLLHPPGPEDLVTLSAWFKQLCDEDQENLRRVAKMAAHAAVFGMLCVLDGVKAIEDRPIKGVLDLRYHHSCEEDISLTDESGPMLHDLL
jgi:hypothetical protein